MAGVEERAEAAIVYYHILHVICARRKRVGLDFCISKALSIHGSRAESPQKPKRERHQDSLSEIEQGYTNCLVSEWSGDQEKNSAAEENRAHQPNEND